ERARAWRERMKAALAELKEADSEGPAEAAVSLEAAKPPTHTNPATEPEQKEDTLSPVHQNTGTPVHGLKAIQQENFRLREENEKLYQELERLKSAPAATETRASRLPEDPLRLSASVVDLSALREEAEKRSIVASLRRHLGNRLKASRELRS